MGGVEADRGKEKGASVGTGLLIDSLTEGCLASTIEDALNFNNRQGKNRGGLNLYFHLYPVKPKRIGARLHSAIAPPIETSWSEGSATWGTNGAIALSGTIFNIMGRDVPLRVKMRGYKLQCIQPLLELACCSGSILLA